MKRIADPPSSEREPAPDSDLNSDSEWPRSLSGDLRNSIASD